MPDRSTDPRRTSPDPAATPTATGIVVRSPLPGRALPLTEVPDPVFSTGMVGPGAAIEPSRERVAPEPVDVVAPVDGVLVKLHPHAFVVQTSSGTAVLVHLGIDTVQLHGEGFTLLSSEGDELVAGQPVTRWDVDRAVQAGFSTICPLIALDTAEDRIGGLLPRGTDTRPGDSLFTIAHADDGQAARIPR